MVYQPYHLQVVATRNAIEDYKYFEWLRGVEFYLSNITNNRYFLLIFTPFSKHTKVKHTSRTVVKFNYNICIVNNIWHLPKVNQSIAIIMQNNITQRRNSMPIQIRNSSLYICKSISFETSSVHIPLARLSILQYKKIIISINQGISHTLSQSISEAWSQCNHKPHIQFTFPSYISSL